MNKHSTKQQNLLMVTGVIILLVTAATMTAYLIISKWQPSGNDVWSHLYKSKVMYDKIGEGILYPLYSDRWYNGIQLYRYWPPLVYYLMALLQLFTGGDIIQAYYLFAGVSIFFGGLPFLLTGRLQDRTGMGIFCSVLWFFMPDNIRVYFCEGNMPRMVTSILIPYVVFFLWLYVRKHHRPALIGLMISMALMTVGHLMMTAITGIGTFLFLLIDVIHNKNYMDDLKALVSMVIGILIAGIWFIPALSGGLMSMGGDSSVSSIWSAGLSTTLNPINRIHGVADSFYFGIGCVVISLLGLILANNRKKTGFLLALIVLVGTTPEVSALLEHVPLGSLMWMSRFFPMAYAYFLLSLLEWRTLKPKYALIAALILSIDSGTTVVCLPHYYTPTTEYAIEDCDTLKALTTQRANLMELSSYGSYPSWGLAVGEDSIAYTYGWAWQGAATADNIMYMNEALEREEYPYIFDRSIEMGDDTILIKKQFVHHEAEMFEAASVCGYDLIEESGSAYFFHKNTPESFGVRSTYSGLAIGDYAGTMTVYYPTFCPGDSSYIDDYTEEELSEYETLFLTGFQYHDQKKAEQLLRSIAASGTRIVIDCAHFPEDSLMEYKFMGMTADQITFKNSLSNLQYNGRSIPLGTIPSEDRTWQTAYLLNLDHVSAYMLEGGNTIPCFGYNDSDENIYFLGSNLMFFAMNTENEELWGFLNECLQLNHGQVINRELVPTEIQITDLSITIRSAQAGINTTLAYQDNFRSEQTLRSENHLLAIDDKEVVIQIVYPLFRAGMATTILGICLGIALMILEYHLKNKMMKETDS